MSQTKKELEEELEATKARLAELEGNREKTGAVLSSIQNPPSR